MKTKIRVMILVGVMLSALILGTTGAINMVNGSAHNQVLPSDRLIGVFMTKDRLDLLAGDSFTTDTGGHLENEDKTGETERAKDSGRLYASSVEKKYTDDETGESSVVREYVFDGIEGISFFTALILSPSCPYRGQTISEVIAEGSTHYHSTDKGENISLKGTIYVLSGGNLNTPYVNPVYQTTEGEVYAVSGDAMMLDGYGSETIKIGATQSKTGDGSEVLNVTEVEVTVRYMDKPTSVAILQFDEKNQLLSRTAYLPGSLPDALQIQSGAQYLIVETITASKEQSFSVARELYQKRDETLFAFFCREDGLCVKQMCAIDWNH